VGRRKGSKKRLNKNFQKKTASVSTARKGGFLGNASERAGNWVPQEKRKKSVNGG